MNYRVFSGISEVANSELVVGVVIAAVSVDNSLVKVEAARLVCASTVPCIRLIIIFVVIKIKWFLDSSIYIYIYAKKHF